MRDRQVRSPRAYASIPSQSSYEDVEKAFAALDMFVIADDEGDYDHVRFTRAHANTDID